MAKVVIHFLILLLTCSTAYSSESKKKQCAIATNQSPLAYLKLGHYFLDEPHIPLAVESFEKAVEQEEDLEVRARGALSLGRIYYFEIGGFSDPKKLDHYLSVAGLAACQLPGQKEIIRITQVLRQPKPFDLEQVNGRGESPLHYAAKKGYIELLQLLFTLGAHTIMEKELCGQTALYLACSYGEKSAVELLIAQGAETDRHNTFGYSLLHVAVNGNHKELLHLLLKIGLKLSAHCDDNGLTAFYRAAELGHLQCAAIMLSDPAYDAYVDEENLSGWTSLHWAALRGDIETAKFLVRNGARINSQTSQGDTPLHMAACSGNEAMVVRLMRLGSDRSIRNKQQKLAVKCSETYIPELAPDYELAQEQSASI
jgi:ankyrin repeat protein